MTIDIHFDEMPDERKSRINWKIKRALLFFALSRGLRWAYKARYEQLDDDFEVIVLEILASISVSVAFLRKDVQKLREEMEDFDGG